MGSGRSGYSIGRPGGETAGSHDDGFKGGTSIQHSIGDNLDDLKDNYDYREGYFGTPSARKNSRVRHIESGDPLATARDFYDRAAKGGLEEPLPNGRGVKTTMSDGTVVSMCEVSGSDKTPVVEIIVRRSDDSGGVKEQKIHFIRKEGK